MSHTKELSLPPDIEVNIKSDVAHDLLPNMKVDTMINVTHEIQSVSLVRDIKVQRQYD